ncbi:CHAT domain-containing protein [Ideonella azotifigens]|uniref:CHAT domain-containing protein n=2 Tax=Ideonella azotifigens TaxID=513160 RepID=A0ABN1KBX4_9BURK|nr:CHAT domain-containing protein [Ideonella azotifigens]MCD2344005.1 CHAT domain-containing protein [Ideonella azotifigens]
MPTRRPPSPSPNPPALKLQLPGHAAPARSLPVQQVAVQSARRIELDGGTARRGGGADVVVGAAPDEVLRLTLEDGLVLWSRVDDFLQEHGQAPSTRGKAAGNWAVPPRLVPKRLEEGPKRGAVGVALQALELFGVDVAGHAAAALGAKLEARQLGGRAPGLYRVTLDDGPPVLQSMATGELPADAPLLVFLHGTMSSLAGSFGDLWRDDAQAQAARATLHQSYGGQVFAFEHRSLTESPVANALALAKALPAGARLHLVSHSRGGLVGELLCLAQRTPASTVAILKAGLFDGMPKDQADLAELLQVLDAKRLSVARFVRVACPARGTTLASGRLDRWLSVLGMLAGDGWLGDATDFLLKVVKERTDPRTLPGLEAMMPGSALTRLLRLPGLQTTADLSAITGDLAPEGRWGKLKLLAVDWFYGADNDLVVNTGSMAGGLARPVGGARFRFAQGPAVHHFSYFNQAESVRWLLDGLTRADDGDGGFLPLDDAQQTEPKARAAMAEAAAANLRQEPEIAGTAAPLQVSVLHGNLRYVPHALLIGHYAASRLTGTEAAVDRLIGGAMQQSLSAGLYPEAPGTQQLFRHAGGDTALLPLVIVAGLGEEGQLRLPELVHTVQQAVIAFVQQQHGAGGAQGLTLAATLLGSGGVGMTAGSAAQAIVMGVREAGQRLRQSGWAGVAQLQLVELYLDRATEAWQGLSILCGSRPGEMALVPEVLSGTGGMRRPAESGYRGTGYDCFSALTVPDRGDEPGGETGADAHVPSGEGAPRASAIAYTLDTHRARYEVRALRTQPRLLRSLVQAASTQARHDPALGRALFKLLIPAEIEAYLGGSDSGPAANELVIQLDPGTAGIPWELLDASAEDGETRHRPWALRTRLLRRLALATGSPTAPAMPHDARADDAVLVIGEPQVDLSRYGALPGARAEARAVLKALQPGAAQVLACVPEGDGPSPSAHEVITTLLARDYRLLHVAGHGEPGADGGVVLSDGNVLGPREVAAMRRVPELVFLNCCHLAQQPAGALLASTALDWPRWAAGLAGTLVGMGVRCVVAAGWAVDDAPAALFAETFYASLLRGHRFIDAVGEAREAAWAQHPQSNTWAAYQCYGDPDWRWRTAVGDAQSAPAAQQRFEGIVSAPALALQLENLLLGLRHSGLPRVQARAQITELVARFGARWGGCGAVAEAFGLALAECEDWPAAAEWLQRAVAAEDASASMATPAHLARVRKKLRGKRPAA